MNLDKLQRFPNQNLEARAEECVGETVADIIGNIIGTPMDAGFSYAAAHRVGRTLNTIKGADPLAGMLGGVVYGALATIKEPFDATTTSERYEGDIANYPPTDVLLAHAFAQNGVVFLDGAYEIASWVENRGSGIMVPMKWYENFMQPNPDGTLPMPAGNTYTYHVTACYRFDPQRGFQIKPWLGPDFGDHGYCYIPAGMLASVSDAAYAFNSSAWRWMQLAKIGVTRPWLANDLWPQL